MRVHVDTGMFTGCMYIYTNLHRFLKEDKFSLSTAPRFDTHFSSSQTLPLGGDRIGGGFGYIIGLSICTLPWGKD